MSFSVPVNLDCKWHSHNVFDFRRLGMFINCYKSLVHVFVRFWQGFAKLDRISWHSFLDSQTSILAQNWQICSFRQLLMQVKLPQFSNFSCFCMFLKNCGTSLLVVIRFHHHSKSRENFYNTQFWTLFLWFQPESKVQLSDNFDYIEEKVCSQKSRCAKPKTV